MLVLFTVCGHVTATRATSPTFLVVMTHPAPPAVPAPEPRTPASRIVVELGSESNPLLIRFCIAGSEGIFGTLDGYALRTTAGWVFIDPPRPTTAIAERLSRLVTEAPIATLLTSDGHERFCYALRQQWGTPVWGPTPGEGQRPVEYEGRPDHLYVAGDTLPGGLRAIKLAGMWRGDHALLWHAPSGERILFSGDILNGQVEPDLSHPEHFRRRPGLFFGARPGYAERHANRAALKASLERLLAEEFDIIAGSHSRPFRDDPTPKAALTTLIQTL